MRAGTAVRGGTAGVLTSALSVTTIAGSTASSAQASPKPERHVSARIVDETQQELAFKGKVYGHLERPYDNRATRLQKKTCRSCDWRVVRKHRTNDRARFTYHVGAPRRGKWFFRVAVPETREYRKFLSRVWYTKRT